MKRIEKLLAPLASIKAQEKYIIGANKDNYYLPEELLERASTALRNEGGSACETELKQKIKMFSFQEFYSAKDLVYNYKPCLEIRELSMKHLKELKFDLSNWEEKQL